MKTNPLFQVRLLGLWVILGLSFQPRAASAATTIHTIGDSTVAVWAPRYYPKTG